MSNFIAKIPLRVAQTSLAIRQTSTTRPFITTTGVFKKEASQSSLPREPKKKSKKKKSQKDLDKPRRPMSAFSLYYKEQRAALGKTDSPPTDVMKAIADHWRKETEDVKAKYNALKEDAKADYDRKMAEWRAKYPPKLSGYNKFVKANFNKANVTSATQLPAESKRVAALWRQLTPEEKKSWDDK